MAEPHRAACRAWWRRHWEQAEIANVRVADMVAQGWEQWALWLEICDRYGYPTSAREAQMLQADAGRTLGFTRVVATKR